jgi:hypothetical protein
MDSYDHLVKNKHNRVIKDAKEDSNLKVAVVLAIVFIVSVNLVAFVYRRDLPGQVTIAPFDHSTASDSNTVIRVNDRDTYKKIISEYFPNGREEPTAVKTPTDNG